MHSPFKLFFNNQVKLTAAGSRNGIIYCSWLQPTVRNGAIYCSWLQPTANCFYVMILSSGFSHINFKKKIRLLRGIFKNKQKC